MTRSVNPDQLAQRVHLWAGEFVGPAGGSGVGEHAGDGLRHVFHIDRLQAGAAAADQRQHREQPREVGERAEQRVAGTEHGARADDGSARKRLLHRPFAAPAGANVRRPRLGSAPMPETSTRRATPAAAASRATVSAPCTCTASKVTPPFST